MTSSPITSSMYRASILGPGYLDEVMLFLSRDVVRNLFMLSWADNYGMLAAGHPDLFHFAGVRDDRKLVGCALVITDRLALVDAVDSEAAAYLGRWYREKNVVFEHVVSSTTVVSPFWDAYGNRPPAIPVRLNRDQQLHVMERPRWIGSGASRRGDFRPTGVRFARRGDLDSVFWASAKMHAEETLEDPLERDADHFRRHVQHRIESDRTFVWINDHHQLMFKADVSAQSRYGAQISGVYTPPNLRGRGIATRAMYDICEMLFDRGFPRVTLYVNNENPSALRVYEKVGFGYHCDYQTIFVERGE